jgi:hypothetical protein
MGIVDEVADAEDKQCTEVQAIITTAWQPSLCRTAGHPAEVICLP